jgi:multicomponent Na+:H+ antiporter subunit E
MHWLILASVCFATWLLLSGYFSALLLLTLGALSSVLVTVIVRRMGRLSSEAAPMPLQPNTQLVLYWPWLIWEVVKANWSVTKIILDPRLPISPTLVHMELAQRTELGQVIYANSITLTPGTVTTSLRDGMIQVHALTREAARELQEGEMSRRVIELEGSR